VVLLQQGVFELQLAQLVAHLPHLAPQPTHIRALIARRVALEVSVVGFGVNRAAVQAGDGVGRLGSPLLDDQLVVVFVQRLVGTVRGVLVIFVLKCLAE